MAKPSSLYERFLTGERRRPSTKKSRTVLEESESDYGRVLFTTALRRLQHKTQVFPLEDKDAVRSRLTHSLEVAYIGRLIATKALGLLTPSQGLPKSRDVQIAFRNMVETACLVHDIGNPPFGHFGEAAIRSWYERNKYEFERHAETSPNAKRIREVFADFREFDGNPQGFRILTRLQWNTDEYGLNLTLSQLGATMKYVCPPYLVNKDRPFLKKAGFFASEESIALQIRTAFELDDNQRFPLAYIMEAADDIAYCLSDIEDGLEKKMFQVEFFTKELLSYWEKREREYGSGDDPALKKAIQKALGKGKHVNQNAFFTLKVAITTDLVEVAAKMYAQHHSTVVNGKLDIPLLECSPKHKTLLKALRDFAKNHLFRRPEAEHLEITGSAVVSGILNSLTPLLLLDATEFFELDPSRIGSFHKIKKPQIANDKKRPRNEDLERRLAHLLPSKHIQAYNDTIAAARAPGSSLSLEEAELYARVHLVVDYVSGMTDRYSLELHKLLAGTQSHLGSL